MSRTLETISNEMRDGSFRHFKIPLTKKIVNVSIKQTFLVY